MFLHFNVKKAVQAAAVLLKAHVGCQMDFLRLLKLLYIADRESLRTSGAPIIGNKPVAMKNGPLHSAVYDLVKGEHPKVALWSRFIRREGYVLTLVDDPGVLELSKHDIRILNEVADEHAAMNDWEVVEKTHEFPEWIKADVAGASTSRPIPVEDILDAIGFSPEDRDAIIEDLKEADVMERLAPRHHHHHQQHAAAKA